MALLDNTYLQRAKALSQGRSGMNLHNILLQQGTRSISRGRSTATSELADVVGDNPALFSEMLADIEDRYAEASGSVSARAVLEQDRANREEAQRLTELGIQESLAAEREKQRKAQLLQSIIGGTLSAGGSLAGAAISAKGLNELRRMIFQKDQESEELTVTPSLPIPMPMPMSLPFGWTPAGR